MQLDNSVAIPVTVMIFTLNEEMHLGVCLESVQWSDDVIVIDSFSSDRTAEIARAAGARVFAHSFEGFGKQRMWAFENAHPRYDWLLILDADERATPDLARELAERIPTTPPMVAAYRLRRRFHMWGRWLRYSSLYPTWVVRVVRNGRVTYANRGHSETQQVDGEIEELRSDLIDENLKGIDEWYERQNRYSTKEAEFELAEEELPFQMSSLFSSDPLSRRAALKRLASRLPFRPQFYFIYSYLLRGGFLEGRDGFMFCVMKSEYQRMIVTKKHDMRRHHRG